MAIKPNRLLPHDPERRTAPDILRSPPEPVSGPEPEPPPMRITTWNVNSLKARLERVLAWTKLRQPDVLCMQETKIDDAAVPLEAFRELGYELRTEIGMVGAF